MGLNNGPIFTDQTSDSSLRRNELKDSKRKYDSVLAGLEAGRGNLEREVNQIRKQHTKERAEFHIQRATLENLHSLQDRLQDAGKFDEFK